MTSISPLDRMTTDLCDASGQTLLESDSNGVIGLDTVLPVTAAAAAPPNGQFAAGDDATFSLLLNGTDTIPVTVPAQATATNQGVADLVADLNSALNTALIAYDNANRTTYTGSLTFAAVQQADNSYRIALHAVGNVVKKLTLSFSSSNTLGFTSSVMASHLDYTSPCYYLHVYTDQVPTVYEIAFTVGGGGATNTTAQNAVSLPNIEDYGSIRGRPLLASGDSSWYTFTLNEPGRVNDAILMDLLASTSPITLTLYHSTQTKALDAAAAQANSTPAQVSLAGQPAGTYYLKISGNGPASYQLIPQVQHYEVTLAEVAQTADQLVLNFSTARTQDVTATLLSYDANTKQWTKAKDPVVLHASDSSPLRVPLAGLQGTYSLQVATSEQLSYSVQSARQLVLGSTGQASDCARAQFRDRPEPDINRVAFRLQFRRTVGIRGHEFGRSL